MSRNYLGTNPTNANLPAGGCRLDRRSALRVGSLGALWVSFAAGLSSVACTQQLIPNTDVADTEQNRSIIDFCEQYRKAVEEGDIGRLLSLADGRYYEDGGNADSSDDIDRTGLAVYLEEKFAQATAVRYEIRYRRIARGRANRVFVDYTYSASYQLPTEQGDGWHRAVAENRLELRPTPGSFTILSGM